MQAKHLFANILIASSLYAVTAQAQTLNPTSQLAPFQMAQATETNTSTSTSTTDSATGTSTSTTEAAPPAQTNTQVDVTTQAAPPAQAPDINVDMPDINMPAQSNEGGTDTTTTTTERLVIDNANDANPAADNNMLYMGIFGVLAVVLIAIIAITMSRRSTTHPTV